MKMVPLGEIIRPATNARAGSSSDYPLLSMTMRDGLIEQNQRFNKRIASVDTAHYKVIRQGQLVVGFPIDEGVLDFQMNHAEAIVSPAYGVWELSHEEFVDRHYLSRFLRSSQALAYYKARLRGSTARRRSLPSPIFLALPVPLPSIDEQRRIAAILDKADALRVMQQRAVMSLTSLRQSIFTDMFGNLEPTAVAGDFLQVQGGLQVTSKRSSLPLEVPYLRVANSFRGRLDLTDVKSMRVTESELTRTQLKAGDLLFVEGHGNPSEIGRVSLWTDELETCVHQNHLIRGRVTDPRLLGEFAMVWFNTPAGASHFQRAGRTTSGLNTISASTVRAAPMLLPPVDRQMEFVDTVAHLTRQAQRHEYGRKRLDALFASLLTRAFSGQL